MLRYCCIGVVIMKRVMVNFTDEQWKILEKFRGIFGNSDSEIVKYIVIAYLSEKSYLKEAQKST